MNHDSRSANDGICAAKIQLKRLGASANFAHRFHKHHVVNIALRGRAAKFPIILGLEERYSGALQDLRGIAAIQNDKTWANLRTRTELRKREMSQNEYWNGVRGGAENGQCRLRNEPTEYCPNPGPPPGATVAELYTKKMCPSSRRPGGGPDSTSSESN